MGKVVSRQRITGLSVICEPTSEILGIINDVEYDPEDNKINGIIAIGIRNNKVFSIPLDYVLDFSESKVTVRSNLTKHPKSEAQSSFMDKKVVWGDNIELGFISNIIFDPESGQIKEYEVSQGIIDDFIMGRKLLAGHFRLNPADEVVKISSDQNIELKSNNKGILNILSGNDRLYN